MMDKTLKQGLCDAELYNKLMGIWDNDCPESVTEGITNQIIGILRELGYRKLPDRPKLKKELEEILDECVGFPPNEVPKWVDFDLAVREIMTLVYGDKK